MTAAVAQLIDLDARRALREFGWHTLGMLNSSTCRRDACAMYARLGLHPILLHGVAETGGCTCSKPGCENIGKHPVSGGWQSDPLDLASLDYGLRKDPRRNIGLRMGLQPSGLVLVAIDIDGPRTLLEQVEREEGMPFPATLTAKTSRGLHLIYQWPTGREPPRNKQKLWPSVDVRGVGGQIVAPPSMHWSGVRYKWLDARAPEVLP